MLEAQRDTLRTVLTLADRRHAFKRGDFVRYIAVLYLFPKAG